MDKNKQKESKVLELLIRNNKEEIHEFIISNGKSPKAVCPIIFLDKDNK